VKMSKTVSFTVDNFHRDKEGNSYINFDARGSYKDLINLLASAMDFKEVRELLYTAVEVDKEHDRLVGRRNDLHAIVEVEDDNPA